MLVWIIEILDHPRGSEYLVVVVEALQGSIDGFNGLHVVNIAANKITTVGSKTVAMFGSFGVVVM